MPGRWAGGFRAWDEHGVHLATGRETTGARVLRVPAEDLHRLWAGCSPLELHLVEGVSPSAGLRRRLHRVELAVPRALGPRQRADDGEGVRTLVTAVAV